MAWVITKLPIYHSKKEKKKKRTAQELIRGAARKRASDSARRKSLREADKDKRRRNIILRIKALREQKIKWKDIEAMLGIKNGYIFYYNHSKKYLNREENELIRTFNCAKCGRLVEIRSCTDRRKKFCSPVCERRYWRHAKGKGAKAS